MAATGGSLLERVRRIVGQPTTSPTPRGTWLAGAVVLLSVCAMLSVAIAMGSGENMGTSKAETEAATNGENAREVIGELFGKPVYRDEIRASEGFELSSELRGLFAGKVMEEYQKARQSEITPTDAEIEFAAAYFDKQHEKRIEEQAAELREQLQDVQRQLKNSELPEEARRKFEAEQRSLQGRLNPPGREFAQYMLGHWKFQRHLYQNYGGGRILWQQAGLEAFDAMRNWLEAQEKQGKFKITDPELRKKFYEYWTAHDHGAFLTDDPERIRREFLEPPWMQVSAGTDEVPQPAATQEPAVQELPTKPESDQGNPQSDRDMVLAYARALAVGDFETLEQFWILQDDLDREFARKMAERFARTPDMKVELVSMQRLGDDSLFACFLTNTTPDGFAAGRRTPLPMVFHQKDGQWRCGPPGNLRSVVTMQRMGPERIGRRAIAQQMILARFGPDGHYFEHQLAHAKAQAEAFERLAGPPYNLSEYESIARQLKENLEKQEAMQTVLNSKEDVIHLALKEMSKDALPQPDDFYLSFYLEADKDDLDARELPFADGQEPFMAEPFPCLTEDAILSAAAVKDPVRGDPQINVTLTEGGTKLFAEVTRQSIGRRLAIVVDGKVVGAPTINGPITAGKAAITGGFTREAVEAIAAKLNSYQKEAREFLDKLDKVKGIRENEDLLPIQETPSSGSSPAVGKGRLSKVAVSTGEIGGILLGHDEAPVSQATVVLFEQETGFPVVKETYRPFNNEGPPDLKSLAVVTTDTDGKFHFAKVPQGRYRVVAQSWPAAGPVTDVLEINGREIALHGVADDIRVPSEGAENITVKPLGKCTVFLDEDFPNSDALLVVSTKPLSADPILGFASWRGAFLQHMIGANRMPEGFTQISGLPEGKVYLSVFANDNNGGIGAAEVTARKGEIVHAEPIEIVCGWSNGRHDPPPELRQTFEEMREIAAGKQVSIVSLLDDALADRGITIDHTEEVKHPIMAYMAHLEEKVTLPSGREVRIADVLASIQYIKLQNRVQQRRQQK